MPANELTILLRNRLKGYDRKGFSQAYLGQEGAPTYQDKMERLEKNKREGFVKKRQEKMMRDEL